MKLKVLRGKIEDLATTRQSADFVFTAPDQHALGAAAVLAGVAGMSGQAISMGTIASDTQEAADYLEFSIAGKQIKGWFWRSPFKEGDEVDLVAIEHPTYYQAYAVVRPQDRMIALYPHCLRGTRAHVREAVRAWRNMSLWLGGLMLVLGVAAGYGGTLQEFQEWMPYVFGVSFFGAPLVAAWIQYRVASRWAKFAYLAEEVFTALGFDRPSEVDLPSNSKKARKKGDPFELGLFYFRY